MAGFGSGSWMPQADVYETPDAFVVLLELPGLVQEDVEVGVTDNLLTVKGERRLLGPRPESFFRMERSYGAFSRSFRFGAAIDTARVSAQFSSGLLRLELPKLAPKTDWRVRAERSG
jgi:HSP20 family protein